MKLNSERRNYYNWLCRLIEANDPNSIYFRYHSLLTALFEKDFYWFVGNDDNRASDGKSLRYLYTDSTGETIESFEDEPCSCLEMLIGLAKKWDQDISYEPLMGDQSSDRFWEMISNLGLEEFDGLNFDAFRVDDIVETWLGRRYRKDGFGGLFPLEDPHSDQRKVEIWFQLQQYVIEQAVAEDESKSSDF